MTEQPTLPGIELAQAQIDTLASKVGLVISPALPKIEEAVAPPPGATIWSSSYALLLFWPLASADPSLLESKMLEAEGWIDAALRSVEGGKEGAALDGYLVLALPNVPPADAYDEIRRIELSSRICRKHLIWPTDAGDEDGSKRWSRVADVTVLGLPATIMAPSGELQWPDLQPAARDVWQQVFNGGGKEAARNEAAQLGLNGEQP